MLRNTRSPESLEKTAVKGTVVDSISLRLSSVFPYLSQASLPRCDLI